MGFLNLSAWRRATAVLAQPPKYYYDNIRDFQGVVDSFFEEHGRRPADLPELYLWRLEKENALADEARAVDLADLFAYYDIEPNSLLGMVSIDPDKPTRARKLLEARQLQAMKRRAEGRRKEAV
jgi:hypothetical protein